MTSFEGHTYWKTTFKYSLLVTKIANNNQISYTLCVVTLWGEMLLKECSVQRELKPKGKISNPTKTIEKKVCLTGHTEKIKVQRNK